MFTERLIEIRAKYFVWSSVIQTLMGFHSIGEVNEPETVDAPIGSVFKASLRVPHIHQGADDSFGFAVGLWPIDACELLTDTVLCASFAESVIVSSFKFLAVIGISIVDLIRILGNDSVDEKASCSMLSFIGENIGLTPWRNHQ